MAADRRRRMVSTFDRENKPINAATVLAALRTAVGDYKYGVARILRARPNTRTFAKVQAVLDELAADGKVEIEKHGGMRWYFAKRTRR